MLRHALRLDELAVQEGAGGATPGAPKTIKAHIKLQNGKNGVQK